MDQKTFVNRVKQLRLQKGVTQDVVALNVKLSTSGYSNIESGHNLPSMLVLVALADYFDVSLDYLCGRDRFLIK